MTLRKRPHMYTDTEWLTTQTHQGRQGRRKNTVRMRCAVRRSRLATLHQGASSSPGTQDRAVHSYDTQRVPVT